MRLTLVLSLIYASALVDRVNLPSARIAGMNKDTGLPVGDRYSIIAMIFFIPYILTQFPGTVAIRKIGTATWMSGLVIAWGPVTVGMGFTTSWTQVLGCRILVGAFEGAFYPGCIYLQSCWYVRYEVQMRFALFYLFGTLVAGLANIFAYGLSRMEGVGGLRGWRWIFIIEGLVTIVLGFIGLLIIVDFPDKATKPNLITRRAFLTEHEAAIIVNRINRDRGDAVVDDLTWAKTKECLKDWKAWEFGWLFFISIMMTYAYALFMPIILRVDMGYSLTMSFILAFPPHVTSVIWYLVTAYISDRYRWRGQVIVFGSLMSIVGLCMTAFAARDRTAVRYAGIFIGMSSNASVSQTIFSYMHNNIVGQKKRSIASAILVTDSAIAGLAASNIFRQADAPRYTPAMITLIVTQVVLNLHVIKNFFVFGRANRRADRGEVIIEGTPGFRYTL